MINHTLTYTCQLIIGIICCRYITDDKADTAPGAIKKLKLNNANKRDLNNINTKSSVRILKVIVVAVKVGVRVRLILFL